MALSHHTERTFLCERWRAITAGILETAGATFLLLITVREFQAGATAKALVAAGGSVGLLLSPWVVALVSAMGWTTSRAASYLSALGAMCFLLMALVPVLPVIVAGSVLAMAAASAAVPLMTQIYQENYPEKIRGRLFSKTIIIRIGTAALFSELAGRLLSDRLHQFQWLLLAFAGAFIGSSVCLAHCPSRPLHVSGRSLPRSPLQVPISIFTRLRQIARAHPFQSWHFVRGDRLFRYTLICWMLMGFANLMMFPLRVEYLANPKYGLALSVSLIALFTGVIPNLARLTASLAWGWLFDHLNFFLLRVVLNIGFGLGILTFFMSEDLLGLTLGAIIFGLSNAGGDVAWSLWVTKFAPPDRVADYMSVHTFFTGVRGVIAPWAAFHLVTALSMATLGWISAGLILVASLMLLPEIKLGKGARPSPALVEEVSE